jgi:hypothetical protein
MENDAPISTNMIAPIRVIVLNRAAGPSCEAIKKLATRANIPMIIKNIISFFICSNLS